MAIDHRQHHLENIRATLSLVVYPLQYVVSAPFSAADWAEEKLSTREKLLEENTQLRTQRQLLMAQLQKLSALKVENIRLRELLKSSQNISEHVLVAELLAVDLEPFARKIVINKGSVDDVYLGQPLLDAEGIMGQVIHAGHFSSTAMLLTDPNHAIPVHVNRNGLRAIAMGTGAPDVLDIPYLPNSADIEEGDLLTSSGLGGRFPRDYPVAKVISVVKDPSKPYAVIKAKPTASLETSREVLLVWSEESPRGASPVRTEQAIQASAPPGGTPENVPATAPENVPGATDRDGAMEEANP